MALAVTVVGGLGWDEGSQVGTVLCSLTFPLVPREGACALSHELV